MSPRNQPSLFDDAPLPEPPEEIKSLGKKLPANVRLGTTTWTYDGWKGTVYSRDYRGPEPARRLEEYGRYPLFRVVGIDSAYTSRRRKRRSPRMDERFRRDTRA